MSGFGSNDSFELRLPAPQKEKGLDDWGGGVVESLVIGTLCFSRWESFRRRLSKGQRLGAFANAFTQKWNLLEVSSVKAGAILGSKRVCFSSF